MKDIDVIDAFDHWWNTKPESHIPAPRHCHMKMQQDRMLAIWISAWNAATNNKAPTKEITDEEIKELWKQFENDETPVRSFARAILRKAQEK